MKRLYYPIANIFGNAIIIKGMTDDGLYLFCEKNNGLDGDMVLDVDEISTGKPIVKIIGEPTLSQQDQKLTITVAKKAARFMFIKASEAWEIKVRKGK